MNGVLKIIVKERTIDTIGNQFTSTELLVIPGSRGNAKETTLHDLIEEAFREAKCSTIEKYKHTTLEHEHLAELLGRLGTGELKKFWMIFRDAKGDVTRIPKDKMKRAIELCERSLKLTPLGEATKNFIDNEMTIK